jgi:hypothetical protein
MDRPSCSKVPQCFGSRILRAQSPPLHRYDQLAPCPKGRHYSLTGGSVKLERVRVPKAPKGPALSSRRFQPAESRAERMTPTPTGLIPPARDPFRAGTGFSPPSRGFHPASAGLFTACPFGAVPAPSSRVARIAVLSNVALPGL